MSNARVAMFLETRNAARRRGDSGLARAMDAELDRLGYIDPDLSGRPESVVVQMPERAVPPKPRRKRAPKPSPSSPPPEGAAA